MNGGGTSRFIWYAWKFHKCLRVIWTKTAKNKKTQKRIEDDDDDGRDFNTSFIPYIMQKINNQKEREEKKWNGIKRFLLWTTKLFFLLFSEWTKRRRRRKKNYSCGRATQRLDHFEAVSVWRDITNEKKAKKNYMKYKKIFFHLKKNTIHYTQTV